ncbi:unnamed protein product, partial [Choristocarpus tenellus]
SSGTPAEVVAAALAKRQKAPPEWPPSFQEAGGSYVFDGQSGYFYESLSGVYYDPRSKLYCKAMKWYQHTPDQDPPFTVVDQTGGTDQASSVAPDAAMVVESKAVASGNVTTAKADTPGAGAGAAGEVGGGSENREATQQKAAPGLNSVVLVGKKGGGKKQTISFGFKGAKQGKGSGGDGGGGVFGRAGG